MGIEAMDTTMEMEEPLPAAKPAFHAVVGGAHGHPGGGIHSVHGQTFAPDTPPMLGVMAGGYHPYSLLPKS